MNSSKLAVVPLEEGAQGALVVVALEASRTSKGASKEVILLEAYLTNSRSSSEVGAKVLEEEPSKAKAKEETLTFHWK